MNGETIFNIENGVLTGGNFQSVTHVEIPEGVTAIRSPSYKGVFGRNTTLETVVIPEGVEEIGDRTFFECYGLKTIVFPSTLKIIGDNAFYNCNSLKSITIPEGIEKIGDNAFCACEELQTVVFPDSMKQIPKGLFSRCEKLTNITLPENLERIGDFAFSGCKNLCQIEGFRDDLELGDGAFYGCFGLADASGFIILGKKLFGYHGQETELVLPSGITEISGSALSWNSKLTCVTIPKGVQKICSNAFRDCSNLQSVVIPDGVEEIGLSAFSRCVKLKAVHLPDSIKKIGSDSFGTCNSLAQIRFSPQMVEIPSNAFNTTALTEVEIPEGVHTIGRYAFNGCRSLTTVRLPQTLKRLDQSAFGSCTSLEEILIPEGVEEMDCFSYCDNLKKLNLPAALKKINGDGFEDCKKIPFLRISAGVEMGPKPFCKDVLIIAERVLADTAELAKSNFSNGSSVLASVGTSEQVTYKLVLNGKLLELKIFGKNGEFNRKIYDNLLTNNEGKLPSALLTLAMLCRLRWNEELAEDRQQYYTEYVCKNIKKVAPYANLNPEDGLIATLEQIGALTARNKKTILHLMGIGEAPASKAKKAEKTAEVDGSKTPAQLKKEWNIKKLEDGTLRLTSYKGSDTVIEVPAMIGKDPVTVIGNECMSCGTWGRTTTEQVAKRKKITSIVVPEGITEIGEDAFYECESLESVTLPNSLKTIGSHAFLRCAKLNNLKLPDGVNIENGAFSGCNALADENGFLIVGGTLFRCLRGGDVVVPAAVTKIDGYAFSNLPDLKSIVFPEGLKSLPRNTVNECRNLEVVTIPPSVTGINEYAFQDRMRLRVKGYSGSYAEQLCKNSWGRLTFESIGVLERNDTGFDISDGILTRYTGKDKHVVIPEGVKKIGGYSINSWREMGAFSEKKVIERVTIPEGVETITDGAFQNCANLHEIEIPSSVVETNKFAFEGTPWFEKQKDASVYVGNVFVHFNEPTTEEFTVREGTVSIGDSAFREAHGFEIVKYPLLKRVILPEGLKRIEGSAFGSCCNLEELCIPSSVTYLDEYALSGITSLKRCYGGVLHKTEKLPARFKALYTGEPDDTAWLVLYQPEQSWRKAVRAKMDEVPESIGPAIEKMAHLIDSMDCLDKAIGNRAASFAQELCRGAGADALQALYQALKNKDHPMAKKLDLDDVFKACMEGGVQEDLSKLHPVEVMVVQNLKYTPAFEKLLGRIPGGVPYADSNEVCAERVLAFVAYEYIRQYDPESVKYVSMYASACTAYSFSDVADEVAAALDHQKLQEALLQLAEQYDGEYWLPYARYADDRHTVTLLSQMREWDTWWKYAATGRKNIIIARSGLLLNNTKAAMIHMDKVGRLETYASLRGTDADTIRDTVLADFGFDENREIRYNLGGNAVIVRMADDLSLTIFDTNAGKIVKSIPKKGADAELHANVKTAFSDLKKNIKKVLTNRKHILFADFLSGAEKNALKWKQSYLGNPVLNSIAQLIVWMQAGKTFTLTKEGAVTSTGMAYEITEEPIRVAHPIEMRNEITAWQGYFTSNGLKQPFEQIWEPAYDPAKIREDRYENCSLNVYRLANKEQHGIRVWGLGDYSEDYGFELTDCEMTQDASEWRFIHGITDDATFELGKFTFKEYTRYVNHIVYMFDKWTITDRLLKDDVTVENLLDAFTPAQIQEFIHLTTEKGCINCSAMLLNYRGAHFEDMDPLAEFTLDL